MTCRSVFTDFPNRTEQWQQQIIDTSGMYRKQCLHYTK